MMWCQKEAAASYGNSACSFGSDGLLFDDMVPVGQFSVISRKKLQFQRETILLMEVMNK